MFRTVCYSGRSPPLPVRLHSLILYIAPSPKCHQLRSCTFPSVPMPFLPLLFCWHFSHLLFLTILKPYLVNKYTKAGGFSSSQKHHSLVGAFSLLSPHRLLNFPLFLAGCTSHPAYPAHQGEVALVPSGCNISHACSGWPQLCTICMHRFWPFDTNTSHPPTTGSPCFCLLRPSLPLVFVPQIYIHIFARLVLSRLQTSLN